MKHEVRAPDVADIERELFSEKAHSFSHDLIPFVYQPGCDAYASLRSSADKKLSMDWSCTPMELVLRCDVEEVEGLGLDKHLGRARR